MSNPKNGNNYTNILTATTSAIKTGRGRLVGIVVNKAVASGVITVYDNTAGSGTKIATITHPGTLLKNQYFLDYSCQFTTGLTIVTSSTDDITVIWN